MFVTAESTPIRHIKSKKTYEINVNEARMGQMGNEGHLGTPSHAAI